MIEGYPNEQSTLKEFCDFYGYRIYNTSYRKSRCDLYDHLTGEKVLVNVYRINAHRWLIHKYLTIKPHKGIVK
jgi:hypothetical protein